jgi:predicted ABC-type ATPase
MVAGPNGSGKSTLIAGLRDAGFALPALYINADDLQRAHGLTAERAQQLAEELRTKAIANREPVMYETVASHPSKIAELQRARAAGFRITLLLVATDDPALNVERVRDRVAAGGHDVPEDRIRARYERTLALFASALRFADEALVYDNSLDAARSRAGGRPHQPRRNTPRAAWSC